MISVILAISLIVMFFMWALIFHTCQEQGEQLEILLDIVEKQQEMIEQYQKQLKL